MTAPTVTIDAALFERMKSALATTLEMMANGDYENEGRFGYVSGVLIAAEAARRENDRRSPAPLTESVMYRRSREQAGLHY